MAGAQGHPGQADADRVFGTPATHPGQADADRVFGSVPATVTGYAGSPDLPLESPAGRTIGGALDTVQRWLLPQSLPEAGTSALVTGGTMLGAVAGSVYPPAAPVLRPLGAALGGEAGNLLSKVVGWQPGAWDDPGWSDVLATGLPLGTGLLSGLKSGNARLSRSGRALTAYDKGLAAQTEAFAINARRDAAMQAALDAGDRAAFVRAQALPTAHVPDVMLPQVDPPNGMRHLRDILPSSVLLGAGYLPESGLAAPAGVALDHLSVQAQQALLRTVAGRAWLRRQITPTGLSPAALGAASTLEPAAQRVLAPEGRE